jgi:hypothetical protein
MPVVRRNIEKALKTVSSSSVEKLQKHQQINKTKKITTDGRKVMSTSIMSFHHTYFNRDCNETYPINESLSCDTENC